MACRLVGAKPLPEPMMEYCYLDPRNKLQINVNRNSYIFIKKNPFENVVWKMAAIWSRPQGFNERIGVNFCGLVTPHGDIDLRHHCLRWWLVAWPMLSNSQWGLVVFAKLLRTYITDMYLKSSNSRLHMHLLGTCGTIPALEVPSYINTNLFYEGISRCSLRVIKLVTKLTWHSTELIMLVLIRTFWQSYWNYAATLYQCGKDHAIPNVFDIVSPPKRQMKLTDAL